MTVSFSIREKGATLIELMVGMALFLALAAAGIAFLGLQTRWSARQERIREAQVQVQTALEMMLREIGQAGSGLPEEASALTRAAPDEISFWANTDRERTVLTRAAYPGEWDVRVEGATFRQGRDFEAGDVVWLCGGFGCERHSLARDGGTALLEFKEPVLNPRPGGSSVEVVHHIGYRMKKTAPARYKLIRGVDGGGGPLAENLEGLKFRYRDVNGMETDKLSQIRRVEAKLEVAVSSGRLGAKRVLSGETALRNR